jgi:hypothetical protein
MASYNKYLLEYPEVINRCVSVHFWGRSGSFLLCSLFDKHPEVVCISLGGWMPIYMGLEERFKEIETYSQDDLYNALVPLMKYSDLRGYMKFVKQYGTEGIRYYASILMNSRDSLLKRGQPLNRANILKMLTICYMEASFQQVTTDDPLLVLSIHDTDPDLKVFQCLQEDFRDAKVIYCVRSPVKAFHSHCYHHMFESVHPCVIQTPKLLLKRLLHDARIDQYLIPEKAKVVRFEDIHNQPEKILNSIARWVDIKWSPFLLESTLMGKPWEESLGEFNLMGFSATKAKDNSTKYFSTVDRFKLNDFFKEQYVAWDYKPMPTTSFFMLKFVINKLPLKILWVGLFVEIKNLFMMLRQKKINALCFLKKVTEKIKIFCLESQEINQMRLKYQKIRPNSNPPLPCLTNNKQTDR